MYNSALVLGGVVWTNYRYQQVTSNVIIIVGPLGNTGMVSGLDTFIPVKLNSGMN